MSILLALVVLAVSPDVDPPNLQGSWVVTKAQREGKEAPEVIGHELKINRDEFEIREGSKLLFKGKLTIDRSRGSLWRVDIEHNHGDLKGKKWLGVLRVRETGVFDICDNAINPAKPRPEALESKPDSGSILLEFRRPTK